MKERFVPGETFAEIIETAQGPVVFVADVEVEGTTLYLHNILIEPMHTKRLQVGNDDMFKLRTQIKKAARDQGYTKLAMEAVRTKENKARRPLRHTGSLQ